MHRREVLEQTARTLDVTLVQKDARTFVGAKGRRMYVNLTGNAAMAKAGSGDVLAGIIGGLMVQGCDNLPLFLEFISMDLREILQEMKWGAIVYWRGILLMHLDQRSK